MMKASAKRTATTYARSNAHGLTLAQQNAVDLLAAGKNDTETAAALNLNRVTVTRWRLYSPEFRAALAAQRYAVWGASADRLRALLPKALDTLAEALEQADDKVTVALAVLKLASPLPLVPTEPADSEDILRCDVDRERERNRQQRSSTWSESNPQGRWRAYEYDELVKRDKVNLDLFWLRDESLEESEALPKPDVLAQEIADDLETALEQFQAVAGKLKDRP